MSKASKGSGRMDGKTGPASVSASVPKATRKTGPLPSVK